MPMVNREKRWRTIKKFDQKDMRCCTLELAKRYLADFPDHAAIWYRYGRALYSVGRHAEALLALHRAKRLCPLDKLDHVMIQLGYLYQWRGNFRRAEAWYRKAIRACPSDVDAYIFLGELLVLEGRLVDAEAIYRQGTQCQQGCINEAFFNLGLVLRSQGRYSEAVACFRRALEIDPKYKEAKKEMADVERAIELKRNARPRSTARARGVSMPGNTRKKQWRTIKRFDLKHMRCCTLELARRYLSDFPAHTGTWVRYGRSLYSIGRYTEALSALRRAKRLCRPKKLHFLRVQFGCLYERRGNFRRAEAWYRQAILACPSDADAYIYLGGLLATEGRLTEAEAIYRQATRCKQGCVDEAYLNLGLVLRAQERYSEAVACFRRALEIDPKYKNAKTELADVERAMELIRNA